MPLTDLERLGKRLEDLVLGSAALLILALPMLLIAAAIRATSPGPVIYRQRRHGLDGREIWIHKFRTLTVCESDEEFQPVRPGDPRVTPLGRILRSTSLDELPQLFDALRGDMSLVGPRPHPVPLNERFADVIEGFPLRHRMKPGMTGWAQIHGLRGNAETEGKMRGRVAHDLAYVYNWSLWLDLKILALTPFRLLAGERSC
jgi:putative colanic acid biosynthesis UDP-glucose lipid carrier transferase